MIWRAVAIWLVILLCANLNGALREALLIRPLGPMAGRAVSTILLLLVVLTAPLLSAHLKGILRPSS